MHSWVSLPLGRLDGTGWTLDPLQLLPVACLALAYAGCITWLARRGRGTSWWRVAAMTTAVALLVVAIVSPLATIGEERLFWVHMAQHLLLGDLGPLLMVLALTGSALLPLLSSGTIRSLGALTHPGVALPLWLLNLYLWHVPRFYEAALRNDAVHAVEHACFFAAGVLLWAAVIEPLPGPRWFHPGWKLGYLVAVQLGQMVLALVLIWSGHAFYSSYRPGERLEGISPTTDQALGGAVMLAEGTIVLSVVFSWTFMRWLTRAEQPPPHLETGASSRQAG